MMVTAWLLAHCLVTSSAHSSLHAGTPARSTLRRFLRALARLLSPFGERVFRALCSKLPALSSWLLDLTSPSAQRRALLDAFCSGGALGSLLCQVMNSSHLIKTQPYEQALQAASRPIVENAPVLSGLTDGLAPWQPPQKSLSEALKGMLSSQVPFRCRPIHNHTLSIWLQAFCPATPLAGREVPLPIQSEDTDTIHGLKAKKGASTFSAFNHTKPGPWIGQKVKRGFLAVALKKSDLDFLNDLWHRTTLPALPGWGVVPLHAGPLSLVPGGYEASAPIANKRRCGRLLPVAHGAPSVNRAPLNTLDEFRKKWLVWLLALLQGLFSEKSTAIKFQGVNTDKMGEKNG